MEHLSGVSRCSVGQKSPDLPVFHFRMLGRGSSDVSLLPLGRAGRSSIGRGADKPPSTFGLSAQDPPRLPQPLTLSPTPLHPADPLPVLTMERKEK